MEDKIYLIGMPGSGKSTLGKQLAEKLSMDFVDLDLEIEKRERKTVAEIFEQHKEVYFRKIEMQVLRDFAGSGKRFIMATGGGTPIFHNNLNIMNHSGTSVYINISFNELFKRLKNDKSRPLLKDFSKETLLDMYMRRTLDYVNAKIILYNPTLDEIIKSLS